MPAYTEDHLVEQPAIQLMQHELGWDVLNCFGEWANLRQGSGGQIGGVSDLGREGKREVVLTGRLKAALLSLNPDLPEEAIDGAVEELSRDRTALSLVEANREIDKLLKGGVTVKFPDKENGGQRVEVVAVIDWEVVDISLNTLLRGTCDKGRLLDLVENFSRFSDEKGKT